MSAKEGIIMQLVAALFLLGLLGTGRLTFGGITRKINKDASTVLTKTVFTWYCRPTLQVTDIVPVVHGCGLDHRGSGSWRLVAICTDNCSTQAYIENSANRDQPPKPMCL